MPVREKFSSELVRLGVAKVSIASATTSNFDFGTPNDINLGAASGAPGFGYRHGDRLLFVFDASTAGTTDTVSFSVQDAPDSSGSIGTPATADTSGTLTGGTGDQYATATMHVKSGRPWIRARVTSTGATDTFVAQCTVFAVPAAL